MREAWRAARVRSLGAECLGHIAHPVRFPKTTGRSEADMWWVHAKLLLAAGLVALAGIITVARALGRFP
jgi:hypothetical protein